MPRSKKTPAQLDREIEESLAKTRVPIAKEDLFARAPRDSLRRQKAMHQALLTWPALIVTGPRGRKTLLIQSGEMSNPEEGPHRVTMFLADGPEGHIVRKSITRLAQDLSRDLFPSKIEPATEDQVMRWMSTPEYIEGSARVLEMQRRNERR
jgi:hypothetical protein